MVEKNLKISFRPCNLKNTLFHPRGDLDRMLEIESESYDDPWDENTISYFLNLSGAGSLALEINDVIQGFLLFEIQNSYLNLVSVAVHPQFRRKGYGTLLVEELLLGDLFSCKKMYCTVSDQNLSAHLFLNKFGFKAVKIMKDFFSEGHDAYEFMYPLKNNKKKKAKRK